MSYEIVCFAFKKPSEVVMQVETLEEAQEICNDPETSSRTCTSAEGAALTERLGEDWFFGYREAGFTVKPVGHVSISAALKACHAYPSARR